MGNLNDLFLLICLGTAVVIWLKLTRARELAVIEVRRQCQRHGLQLLDETVSLRALRLRRANAGRVIERGYGFEVSIDGDDRQPGRLWMRAGQLSSIMLPTVQRQQAASGNEINHAIARLGRPSRSQSQLPSQTRSSQRCTAETSGLDASSRINNVVPFRPNESNDSRPNRDQSGG